MKSKKGKAIAMKLIDDLLGDGDEQDQAKEAKHSNNPPEPPAKVAKGKAKPPKNEQAQSGSISFDSDISNPFVNNSEDSVIEITSLGEEGSEGGLTSFLKTSHKDKEEDSSDKHRDGGGDTTVKLSESKIVSGSDISPDADVSSTKVPQKDSASSPPPYETQGSGKIRSDTGRFSGSGGISSPTQATLVQSENLRIAQQRIIELEEEIERLRLENEQLAAAGETIRKQADNSAAQLEKLNNQFVQERENAEQERELLNASLESKEKHLNELRSKVDEMEMRLSTNIQKIRVRERELENRLELVKMEGQALIRNKDEMILDLKRQLDQLNMELENYRTKGQELNRQLGDKQEVVRRTVKALRIALSMLEGEGDDGVVLMKKVK